MECWLGNGRAGQGKGDLKVVALNAIAIKKPAGEMPVGTEVGHKTNQVKASNGLEACVRSSFRTPPKLVLCNSVPVLSGSKRIVILSAYSMIIDLVNQLF
ncbi:MAG: hypothetical protein V3R14_07020, partial [Nitrospinaceae bacterium]